MTSYQLAKNLPTVTLVAHQGCLIALDWHTQKTQALLAKLLAKFKVKVAVMNSVALSHSIDADAKVLVETITQLKEYQVGQRQVFDIPLDLSSVAVKPPTLGGGYKATPKLCLYTEIH